MDNIEKQQKASEAMGEFEETTKNTFPKSPYEIASRTKFKLRGERLTRKEVDRALDHTKEKCIALVAHPEFLAPLRDYVSFSLQRHTGKPAEDQKGQPDTKEIYSSKIMESLENENNRDKNPYGYSAYLAQLILTYNLALKKAQENDFIYKTNFVTGKDGQALYAPYEVPKDVADQLKHPPEIQTKSPVLFLTEKGTLAVSQRAVLDYDEILEKSMEEAAKHSSPSEKYASACAFFVVGIARLNSSRPYETSLSVQQKQAFDLHNQFLVAANSRVKPDGDDGSKKKESPEKRDPSPENIGSKTPVTKKNHSDDSYTNLESEIIEAGGGSELGKLGNLGDLSELSAVRPGTAAGEKKQTTPEDFIRSGEQKPPPLAPVVEIPAQTKEEDSGAITAKNPPVTNTPRGVRRVGGNPAMVSQPLKVIEAGVTPDLFSTSTDFESGPADERVHGKPPILIVKELPTDNTDTQGNTAAPYTPAKDIT